MIKKFNQRITRSKVDRQLFAVSAARAFVLQRSSTAKAAIKQKPHNGMGLFRLMKADSETGPFR
jgi:hypothetical protein